MESERRRGSRHFLIAEAEVVEMASGTKLRAKTSDLSADGCFLETMNPSQEGSEIVVRISHLGKTFTAHGKVVFKFPNVGMGILFLDVEPKQQEILERWLGDLRR